MELNIKPIGDLIVVKRVKSETETKGGILLPLPNQKSLGEVLAIGKGIFNQYTGKFDTIDISKGDVVVFQTHRGHNYKNDEGDEFLFLGMKNIMAVYKQADIEKNNGTLTIDVDDTVMCLGS